LSEPACGAKVFSDTFGFRKPADLRKVESRGATGINGRFDGYTLIIRVPIEQKNALMRRRLPRLREALGHSIRARLAGCSRMLACNQIFIFNFVGNG
jgi:hypothetical protein